jgi:hypothetical protein
VAGFSRPCVDLSAHCTGRPRVLSRRPTGRSVTAASAPVVDAFRVTEPADGYQRFDLAMWLKGSAAGDIVNSWRNPRLW